MSYETLRGLHIACATLSILLFSVRAALALAHLPWRQWRWLRILPHVNDTVLLGAAIALSAWSQQYPWQAPWLGTKVVLLLVYIGLGKLALRPEQPRTQRWCFSLAALGTVLWLVGVAITRSPTLLLIQ